MTTAEIIASILVRDLHAVQREIQSYETEADMWRIAEGTPNSAGTLALHLAGNLRHYVGTVLGGGSYVRDRSAEFSQRDVPRAEILRRLDAAISDVTSVLSRLTAARMVATFPEPAGGRWVSTEDMLIHLATHVTYHLGQIDYHRRLLSGNAGSIGAVSLAELRSAKPAL